MAFDCISGSKVAFKCLVYDKGLCILQTITDKLKKDRDLKISLLDMILKILFNQYI